MNVIAGLGSVICWSAAGVGLPDARCYDWDTQERLGFAAAAVLLVLMATALQRFGRSS